MEDRLLQRLLWCSVMGLITAALLLAMFLFSSGLILALGGDWPTGSARLACGLGLGEATRRLCRHADDLIGR